MSLWTYVDACFKSKENLTKDQVEEMFGKELIVYPDNYNRMTEEEQEKHLEKVGLLFEEYENDESKFLPVGSEGSLIYTFGRKYRLPKNTKEEYKYVFRISGSLRDRLDPENIMQELKKRFYVALRNHDMFCQIETSAYPVRCRFEYGHWMDDDEEVRT